jgi:hypothetical protein
MVERSMSEKGSMNRMQMELIVGTLILSSFLLGATNDLAPVTASVPEPSTETGAAKLDSVTVTAERQRQILEQRINTFVSLIAMPSWTEGIARWQVPICPVVAGASPGNAEYFQGRVSQVAQESGMPASPRMRDCSPNFVVVLTPEPEEFLRSWWARNPKLFSKNRGARGIYRFIESDDAIRVWYNACSVAPGGTFTLRGIPDCDTGMPGSRLTYDSVRAIYSAIVVVDAGQIDGLNVGQVADYIAMIGLAQIRTASDLGDLPSILRLFADAGPAPPQGLTSWDKSFLKSLYESESGSVKQLSQIKNRMQTDLVR